MTILVTSGCIWNFRYLFLKTWYPAQGPRMYLELDLFIRRAFCQREALFRSLAILHHGTKL